MEPMGHAQIQTTQKYLHTLRVTGAGRLEEIRLRVRPGGGVPRAGYAIGRGTLPARAGVPARAWRPPLRVGQVGVPARCVAKTGVVGCLHMLCARGSKATRAATPWT